MQVEHLRQLNHAGQSEAVISLFESGRVGFSHEVLGEYVKALARLDRLDSSRVMSLMQVRVRVQRDGSGVTVTLHGPCRATGPFTARELKPQPC
jgi:hypothetical protein